MNDYMSKPCKKEEIYETIKRWTTLQSERSPSQQPTSNILLTSENLSTAQLTSERRSWRSDLSTKK